MNRREFVTTSAAAGLSRASAIAARRDAKPPNIIVILADDLGFSDIGCYGSEIATPNIDRLASGGIRFTQFYNAARCCPSRASILTGLYSHQAGIGEMGKDTGQPGYRGFLNDRCVTIAEALRPTGYHPLMVGKWHVGLKRPHWPKDRGFERYFGLLGGEDNYFSPVRHQMVKEDQPWEPASPGFYMTDSFTDYAVDLIGEYAAKPDPFFLYLAYTAPHAPLHAWPEDIAKYRGKYRKGWDVLRRERFERELKLGILPEKCSLSPRDPLVPAWEAVADKDSHDLHMAVYAAQIDRLDQCIGRVLRKIEETGQQDNTLIMFLSDNGGCAEESIGGSKPGPPGPVESYTSYGRPWANASNTPFRLYKQRVHEGGISSPFIAYWPSVIHKRGALDHQPAHIIDVMPTVLQAGGAKYPTSYGNRNILPIEGRSLLPTFQGKSREVHDSLYWEHIGNRAVRQGDWKLVSVHPNDWELYNVREDRTELHDLSRAYPERVTEMRGMYEAWARRANVLPHDAVMKLKQVAPEAKSPEERTRPE